MLAVAHAFAAFGSLFLLPLHGGWLEVLTTPDFRKNPVGLHTLVKAPQETVKRLPFSDTYFSQVGLPLDVRLT